MITSSFEKLAALPFSDLFLAVIITGKHPTTGVTTDFYLTSAPSLFTSATDTPANTQFRNVILKGWSTSRSVSSGGKFLGPSTFNTGNLEIYNQDDAFTDWLALDWNDQPIKLLVGARNNADGTPYSFSDFQDLFVGVVEDVVPKGDNTFEIVVVGRSKVLDDPLVTEFYRGFGGGARTEAAYNLNTPTNAAFVLPGAGTVEWIGRVVTLPAIEANLVRSAPTNGWGIVVDAKGLVSVLHDGGTRASTTYTTKAGDPLYVAQVFSTAKDGHLMEVWAGRDGRDVEKVLSKTVNGLSVGASDVVRVGKIGGNGTTLDIWEIRLWDYARSQDEILAFVDSPLTSASTASGLVEAWKFGDGTGNVALGEKGVADFTYDDTLTWISSLEGDDPEQFDGALLGVSKPEGYGAPRNVLAVPVDDQRHDYHWSRNPSDDLSRVHVRGAPLVPDEVQTSTTGGQIRTTADDKIVLQAPLTGKRYIPGQVDPAINGQRIEIASSGTAADGIYRIADNGVSADGLVISVVSKNYDGAAGLTDLSLGAGTILRSPDGEHQFSYDLTTSTVRMPTAPDGDVTIDPTCILPPSGSATVSDLFELLVGETVDKTRLTWNPEIAFFVPAGGSLSLRSYLDKIMWSCFGWWVETRSGGYRIGNHSLPTGSPKATVVGSSLATIDAANIASVTARVQSLTPIRTKIPAWQLRVGYGQTWHVHQQGSLVGSVPPVRREVLTSPFRWAPRVYSSVKKRYPTSVPEEPIDTYLTTKADGEKYMTVAGPLLTTKRGWFDVDAVGLGFATVDLYDEVFIQHPDPTKGIVGGSLGRILEMDENLQSEIVSMEVFT